MLHVHPLAGEVNKLSSTGKGWTNSKVENAVGHLMHFLSFSNLKKDRLKDANFEKFLDCYLESYDSAGGPKLDKEVQHGLNLSMKTQAESSELPSGTKANQ